jgi:hypothetical protein
MDIDAPPQAIAVWLEGDNIMVRFPDRQLVTMTSLAQLMITLKHRESSATKKRPMTVGTLAAPVQYDIDAIAAAINKRNPCKRPGECTVGPESCTLCNPVKSWDERAKEAGERIRANEERNRARLLRQDAKRMSRKEAEETLAAAGL